MSLARTFLYASKPVNARSSGTSIAAANFSFRRARLAARRSGNRWAIATTLTPCDEVGASSIAPDPRPPQPITPMRMASLSATCPANALVSGRIAVPTAAVVTVFRKSRRVGFMVCSCDNPGLSARGGDPRVQSLQVLLLFDRADDAKADERRIGVPPDALRALRIAAVPLFARRAARGAPQPRRGIVPRPAADHVGIAPIIG